MLETAEVVAINQVLLKCIRVLGSTRRLIKDGGLELPTLTNMEREARYAASVLQGEIKIRGEAEKSRLPGT